MKHFVALIAVLVIACQSFAEDSVRPKASEKPYAMMQKLAMFGGTWTSQTEFSPDGGQTWQKSPASVVNIELRHKGMLLAETPTDTSAPGFHLETYTSYDQYRQMYRTAVIDDTWGIMDIYEGAFDGNTMVMNNLRADTAFPIGEGQWRHFRLSFEMNPDVRTLIIDKTDDGGATWQPNFRVTYTRQQ